MQSLTCPSAAALPCHSGRLPPCPVVAPTCFLAGRTARAQALFVHGRQAPSGRPVDDQASSLQQNQPGPAQDGLPSTSTSTSSSSSSSGNGTANSSHGRSSSSNSGGHAPWLAIWVASAVAFGIGIWAVEGTTKAQEFFAGYALEQCLSLDNLFVFQLVFNYFKTPASGQANVLAWGIGTAAVLRAVLIVAGVQLVQSWRPVLGVFACILLASSYKLLTDSGAEDEEELKDNLVVQLCKKYIRTTDAYDGDRFFTVLADGTRSATPLLLTLAVVEISDIVFAVDSIPAVFGVTLDPFIVYTSNIFAILSLRAAFSFASTVMMQARYLDKSVALVLGFIGVKMLLELGGFEIPTQDSLALVGLTLGAGAAAGYLLPAEATSHAGASEGEDGKDGSPPNGNS